MRREGKPAHHLSGVVLNLTAAEAAELRDTLDDTLAKEPDATWHRTMSADGQVEVTVALDSGQKVGNMLGVLYKVQRFWYGEHFYVQFTP